jgi:Zn-finger protein
LNGLGGVFCEDCDIAKRKSEIDESLQRYFGVADWAVDTDEAARLWELSEEIIKS